MKYKELANLLSLKDLFKLSILSSAGFYLIFFIIGSLLIFMGTNSPVTFNDQEVSGLKGFLLFLAFSPFYIISVAITIFMVISLGLWIVRRFFKLRKG